MEQRFTLVKAAPTATFWKICQGRKWVGRVVTMGDGSGFKGKIGDTWGPVCPTHEEAFREVTAQFWGYEDAAALRRHNAEVGAVNLRMRAEKAARLAPIKHAVQTGDVRGFIDEFYKLLDEGAL